MTRPDNLSPERLALVQRLLAKRQATQAIAPRTATGDARLSFVQERLWFIHRLDPTSPAYNVPFLMRIPDEFDPAQVERALEFLVERHQVLRAVFPAVEGVPVQRILPAAPVSVRQLDFRDRGDDRGVLMVTALREAAEQPFDLETGPLFRATVLHLEPGYRLLSLVFHHIAVDGWSIQIIAPHIGWALASIAKGETLELPNLPLQYPDYAAWQRERFDAGALDESLDYWAKTLAGAPQLKLSTDRPRPTRPTHRGGRDSIRIPQLIVDGLLMAVRRERTTVFSLGLAAFNLLLSRYSGQSDIVVGTPVANRDRPELADLVGPFVNLVVLRTDLAAATSLRDVLARTTHAVRGALEHQETPFEKLVAMVGGDRDAGRNPVFQVTFTTEVTHDQVFRLDTQLGTSFQSDITTRFDLEATLGHHDGTLEATITFNTDLFEPGTIRRMLEDYLATLTELAGDLDRPPAATKAPDAAMSTLEFLGHLRTLDVHLTLDGERLKITAPPGVLTDARKAELARRKEELVNVLKSGANTKSTAIAPIPRTGHLPMSVPQRRLWFLDRLAPGSPTYNIAGARRFTGPIDPIALGRAVDEIVRRHETLRTSFPMADGVPYAAVAPAGPDNLKRIDLLSVAPADREAAATALAADIGRLPFDLARGPLFRAVLIQLGPTDHVFAFAMHHIISDGWSMVVFGQEVASLYGAFVAGAPSPLPELPVQYLDYADWQARHLQSDEVVAQERYWIDNLRGRLPVLQLPTDRPRAAVQSFRGSRIHTALPADLVNALKEVGRAEGASLYMMLLATFYALLHRYTGDEDILVGSPVAGRSRADIEPLIGFFINTLVLRVELAGKLTFRELVGRVRRALLKAQAHQDVPFDRLVDTLKPPRDTGHSPLFQVAFNSPSVPVNTAGGSDVEFDIGTTRYDLTVEFVEEKIDPSSDPAARWKSAGLKMAWEYSSDLFDAETIRRMQRHYHRMLREMVHTLDAPISEAKLLTEDELALLTDSAPPLAQEHDRTATIADLFAAQVAAAPDRPAITAGETTISYQELDRRANQLARELHRLRIGADQRVGICLERSIDMVVAVLATIKAGAAYVPLDPAFPTERLQYMATDAKLAALITVDALRPLLGDFTGPVVRLDLDRSRLDDLDPTPPDNPATASSLAYVIYTSGSTGNPKGVAVEHRSVVNFLHAMRREPGLGPTDKLLSVTTLSFDIAGLELYLPLATGAQIILADRATTTDASKLLALLSDSGATVMQATPATWRLLIEGGWQGTAGLKVLCGGESLPRDLAEQLLERAASVWNLYGPTETTIWSMVHRVEHGTGIVPIGKPIANTTAYLLDQNGQPVPMLVAGELYLGGEGLARGYLDRPDLTAERFVQNPFGAPGSRLYRTGDLARLRSDGHYEWLGRGDGQTKIRGFRIELGEIEAALTAVPGVKNAAAKVIEPRPGDQRLVAYVVPAKHARPTSTELASALRKRLPEYMVPSSYTMLETFPLTPNGKTDRRALPAPDGVESPDAAVYVAPGSTTERLVAATWEEVLGTSRIGLHDNFFDKGGHSLLVVRVHAKLEKIVPNPPSLLELFQYPTVATLAERIDRGTTEASFTDAAARAQRQLDA